MFIQRKVSKYKPTGAAVNYKPYKITEEVIQITIGVFRMKK